jgi:hypothetical protein
VLTRGDGRCTVNRTRQLTVHLYGRDVLAPYIDAKQGMDSLQRGLGDGPSTIITETETHSRANVKVKNNQFPLGGLGTQLGCHQIANRLTYPYPLSGTHNLGPCCLMDMGSADRRPRMDHAHVVGRLHPGCWQPVPTLPTSS